MNILVIALIIALVACVAYIFKLKTGGVSCLEAELQARIKTLEEEYEVLKQKYAILHSAATNVNDANKRVREAIPLFSPDRSLVDRVQSLKEFWLGDYGVDGKLFKRLSQEGDDTKQWSEDFFYDVTRKLRAAEAMSQMQERVTRPFLKSMEEQGVISARVSRECMVKMAMQLFDMVSSFQSPNKRSGQELNVGIVSGNLSETEALNKARIITEFEVDTPLYIRNIAEALKGVDIDKGTIIISGYRFPQHSDEKLN